MMSLGLDLWQAACLTSTVIARNSFFMVVNPLYRMQVIAYILCFADINTRLSPEIELGFAHVLDYHLYIFYEQK